MHQKSLDEIVDTMKLFTSRCNILLDPMLRFTDFLSTQRTATSATTRPALTTLFIRIVLITPLWVLLGLSPIRIVTTKRVVLAFGTVVLTWHSRPARISRIILWRSRLVRRICVFISGLEIEDPDPSARRSSNKPPLPPRTKTPNQIAASLASKRRPDSPGVRFTFTVYENQRRWLGIGWTHSMLAYERTAWTDEHLNPAPSKEDFDLPEEENGFARWRWVKDSTWRIDGVPPAGDENNGWIYYDNKWRDGRRGSDGWGRYTRRRKWLRDAELVEVTPSTETTPMPTPHLSATNLAEKNVPMSPVSEKTAAESEATLLDEHHTTPDDMSMISPTNSAFSTTTNDGDSASTKARKRKWFRRSSHRSKGSKDSTSSVRAASSSESQRRREEEEDIHDPYREQQRGEQFGWGLGDDAFGGFG